MSPAARAYLRAQAERYEAGILICAAADMRELLDATEWRPIATAPRDGTRLLLYWFGSCGADEIQVGRWENPGIGDYPGYWVDGYGGSCEPTHWRPLPPRPSVAEVAP